MGSDLTLTQWVAAQQRDLQRFETEWKKSQQKQGTEMWPERLPEEDWEEQFVSWARELSRIQPRPTKGKSK